MEFRRNGRKGISPVLATVILIAITLIAAIAISGFVFGLFGTFTSTAIVSAQEQSCAGTPETCTVTLYNSGTANTSLMGTCSMSFGGNTYLGTAAIVSGSLKGGSSASVTCTSNTAGSHAPAGSSITGYINVGTGAEVLFAAPAQ